MAFLDAVAVAVAVGAWCKQRFRCKSGCRCCLYLRGSQRLTLAAAPRTERNRITARVPARDAAEGAVSVRHDVRVPGIRSCMVSGHIRAVIRAEIVLIVRVVADTEASVMHIVLDITAAAAADTGAVTSAVGTAVAAAPDATAVNGSINTVRCTEAAVDGAVSIVLLVIIRGR